jgi:hypothetical protein
MLYAIITTDVWLSKESFRLKAIGTSLSHAIRIIKNNKEFIQPTIEQDEHIIIKEYKKNTFEEGTIVFNTQYENNLNQII